MLGYLETLPKRPALGRKLRLVSATSERSGEQKEMCAGLVTDIAPSLARLDSHPF